MHVEEGTVSETENPTTCGGKKTKKNCDIFRVLVFQLLPIISSVRALPLPTEEERVFGLRASWQEARNSRTLQEQERFSWPHLFVLNAVFHILSHARRRREIVVIFLNGALNLSLVLFDIYCNRVPRASGI